MKTNTELIIALRERYRSANKTEKATILDEFVALSGYHRKHAIRRLKAVTKSGNMKPSKNKVYDIAVVEALRVMWEAADRLCGKRRKRALG